MKKPAKQQPSDDSFLNSLEAFSRTPAERQIHDATAIQTVMRFPTAITLGDQDQPFIELWIQFGHRDDSGQRIMDRYVAQVAPELGSPEAIAAASWRRTWFSLFSIGQKQGPYRVIEDLLLGGRYRLSEDPEAGLTPAYTVLSWMRPAGDVVYGIGSPVGVHAERGPWLADRVREMMALLRPQRPGVDDQNLLREMALPVHLFLRAIASGKPAPDLVGAWSGAAAGALQ